MPEKAEKASQTTEKNPGFDQDKTEQLINTVGEALLAKKAEDIQCLDVHELTTLTDTFIVCHGSSDAQVKALADNVTKTTREELGEKPWQKEGLQKRRWVILDYVNVVIHIFKKDLREYYALEDIWSDADITTIEDEQ